GGKKQAHCTAESKLSHIAKKVIGAERGRPAATGVRVRYQCRAERVLERRAETREKQRGEYRCKPRRLSEHKKRYAAGASAECKQIARAETLGGHANRGLKNSGRCAPRGADHAHLPQGEGEGLRKT